MTEPNSSSTENDKAPADTAPDDTVSDDTVPKNQSLINTAIETQSTPSSASTRNWILFLPPEIRLMVYRNLLRLPDRLLLDLPAVWACPTVQAVTGIVRTSKLIRLESIDVFYRENTFLIRRFPRFTIFPSRQIGDRIQNLAFGISLLTTSQGDRDQFICIIKNFGDPSIIRGTFNVRFVLPTRYRLRRTPLQFYLRGLGRFTNFQIVGVDLAYWRECTLNIARHFPRLENALKFVLGPARHRATGQGQTFLLQRYVQGTMRPRPMGHDLTFHPQQFLNAQRFLNAQLSQKNVDGMDYLDGIRLGWNKNELETDQNADESQPPT